MEFNDDGRLVKLEMWDVKSILDDIELIGPNPKKHYKNLTEEESVILDNLSDKDKYLRDRTIESNGKPIDFEDKMLY